ncbi:hypothetical protein SAMN04488542_11774 [Fontibacillus panacisegetis]|uniref:Uncharacterized protein n=1 Tax=Fontibacillus panacisegetis TaxID=670482 RepID=A0A1G7P0Y1_9BACL|nr:hypothetical protein SAMN04488542_11774 [Fontibacillus panacisegetis]
MATIFNDQNVSFKQRQSPISEFAWHTSEKLTEMVKSKYLVFDIRSLDAGKYSYPYHFHRNSTLTPARSIFYRTKRYIKRMIKWIITLVRIQLRKKCNA